MFTYTLRKKKLLSHPSYIYAIDVLIQWKVYITTKLKEVKNMGKSKEKSLLLKPMFCARNMGGGGRMEITWKWTRQEVTTRKKYVGFSKLINFPFTLRVKKDIFVLLGSMTMKSKLFLWAIIKCVHSAATSKMGNRSAVT